MADREAAAEGARKRVLIFVAIPAHFREMVRAVRLLAASGDFAPSVLIAGQYDGWQRDAQTCGSAGVEVFTMQDLLECRQASSAGILARPGAMPPVADEVPPEGGRSPGFVRRMVRKPWRWLYRKFWELRVKFNQSLAAGLVMVNLWCRTLVMLSLGWKLASRYFGGTPKPAGESERDRSIARELVAGFGRLWESGSRMLPPDYRGKRRLLAAAPRFFQTHKFALLLLPEDNHFQPTHFLVHAAKSAGTATVIFPFTIADSREWAEGFFHKAEFQVRGPVSRLMARAFPHWTHKHLGRTLIMPSLHILMYEHLGLTPPQPWLINSGYTDALAAESPFMVDYYRKAGIAPERVLLTGSLADDEIFEQLSRMNERRDALVERLGLPKGRPMLLFSVPPNQLVDGGRPQCEFGTYEGLLRAVMEVLCGCAGWNVVLSLHPRLDPAKLQLLRDYPARIAGDNIATLVPLSDIFVASVSATIRLAIAAGKPTVNYDAYRYRYSDFAGAPGVIAVEDLKSFRNAIGALTGDAALREKVAREQRDFTAGRMMVDGRSGERILALFRHLVAARSGADKLARLEMSE